ncbi:MAG TPA: site-2 protease family protein, partial [Clostridia bacterium]|nr:site-2 protease family protein [Clostridia bacterium]
TVQSGDVVGPVGTITTIAQAVRLGFETVLRLAVLISVNLGFINILPFPALDGGRLTFMLVEMVRGKPVAPQREGVVHFVGFVLLMALMAYLVVKDVSGLFGG